MATATPIAATISVAAADLADALDACRPYFANRLGAGTPAVAFRGEEGRLSLATADHQSAIRIAVPCDGDWPESVVLPGEPLSQVMARLDGTIALDATANGVRVVAGSFSATLPRLSADAIPSPDRDLEERDVTDVRMPVADALRIISAALSATARRDTARPVLEGVLLEQTEDALRAIGTDGYRLVGATSERADIESVETRLPKRTAILPRTAISTIVAATAGIDQTREDAWLTLRLGRQGYRIDGAAWRLVGSYLPGPYPDWERVVAPHATARASCMVKREDLRAALRRAAILADQRDRHAVSVALLPDEVSVQVRQSDGESTETVPAQVDSACVGLGVVLDITLLLPLLDAFTGERVAWTMPSQDGLGPVLLTAPGETTVALVMPIKR